MSKITEKQILDVAKLAKLSIDSSSLPKMVAEFNDILSHIDKLNELKLDPAVQAAEIPKLGMFDDVPRPSNTIEEVLQNAPSSENPFFYIPRVIEGGKA